jgi:DivIVA domain-containing protein
MSITSDQITNQTFPTVRKGYDPAAVNRFLLAGARYDLDRVRTEEATAAAILEKLVTTARRTLDDRARTAPVEVGRTEEFVTPPVDVDADEAADADAMAGDREAATV